MDVNAAARARTAAVTGGVLPESRRVRVGALTLHCLYWGVRTDRLAVLIHGNAGHAHWWDPLVPALAPSWQLIAPDLRGHGLSAWPEPPSYRIEDFSADLLGVLDTYAAAAPAVLIGHSMGGRIAAWCAAHHPERIAGLCLLDTRMSAVNPKIAAKFRGRIAGARHGRGYATLEAALAAFRLVPDEPDVGSEVLADLAYHAIHERAPGDWTFRFDRAVLSLDGDGAGALYELLGRIRCPTLVMHGDSSWVMDPAECETVTGAIPNSASRVFPGGHHFLLSQPRVVGAALRAFLDALLPTRSTEGGRT